MKFFRFVFLRAIAMALLIEPAIAADQVIALKAARLFDGKSRALIQDGVVLAQGDKITDVGANIAIPSGAQVIDLGDATLSPGFIDAHTHLLQTSPATTTSAGSRSLILPSQNWLILTSRMPAPRSRPASPRCAMSAVALQTPMIFRT